MTPAARIEAAIQILNRIGTGRRPADDIVRDHLKRMRYAGSKDRRAIRERVFGALRRWARMGWHLDTAGATTSSPRQRVLADLLLTDGMSADDAALLFDGSRYGPTPFREDERSLAEHLAGTPLMPPEMPETITVEVPDWLVPMLKEAFDDRFGEEMVALNEEAPLDLRVAGARATRAQVMKSLNKENIHPTPTPLSPLGLRLAAHGDISRTKAFHQGLIEVQDEGSQILSLLVDAKPGLAVADFCAGAGGKTLALADRMGLQGGGGHGRLVALDTDATRMERMDRRLERARLERLVDRHVLVDDDPWLADNAGTFERVLVDAPCTGTGTWRRAPAMKWRLDSDRLSALTALQDQILDRAAALVRPGGRLIYATCSLLPAENEDRAEAFPTRHPDFTPLPIAEVWAETLPQVPFPGSDGASLRMSPARTGTDGFFVSIFQRKT